MTDARRAPADAPAAEGTVRTRGPVSIALAGIGGMGAVYVQALLERKDEGLFRIAGAADPAADRCPHAEILRAMGVPLFASLEGFYDGGGRADLAIVSSPHEFHAAQTELALSRGSHVLCEKPAAGSWPEVRRMMQAESRSGGRFVAIGYQWSYSSAVRALKSDILAGLFGRPRRLKLLYLWPRDRAYYGRNAWAGRVRSARGGWVLDSPAQNAMGHDLHNMLYVIGPRRDASARPVEIEAELYRAYPIENYDTAAARGRTRDGVEVLLYVSHATAVDRGPVFEYAFERGVVTCESRRSGISATLADGTVRSYGIPDAEPMAKLWEAIDGAATGRRPACGLEAAAGQVLFVGGMQESGGGGVDFPRGLVREVPSEGGSTRLVVDGLDEVLEDCWRREILPSEAGAAWARPGRKVAVPDALAESGAEEDR